MDAVQYIEIVYPSGQVDEVEVGHAYWLHIINRVFKDPEAVDEGIKSLKAEERVFCFVRIFCGEIFNGGFHQFFTNSSGSYYPETIDALEKIGAERARAMLIDAAKIIYKSTEIPSNEAERVKAEKAVYEDPETMAKMNALDEQYYAAEIEVTEKLVQDYADKHKLVETYIKEYKPKLIP